MKAYHLQIRLVFLAVVVIAVISAGQAYGVIYQLTDLTPSGYYNGRAYGAGGTQQVGYARDEGLHHAMLWNGSAESYVDLHTGELNESMATGICGTQQVGFGHNLGSPAYHAYLWNGSVESWVNLHPSSFLSSCATGTNGTQQVGFAGSFMTDGGINILNPMTEALLWNGSAEDYINLHPDGYSYSLAMGISGSQQVGYGEYDGDDHALYWSGSAASYVDLHPSGYTWSKAYGTNGSQHVGQGDDHAMLWNGTAGSYVDLHPSGVWESCAIDTNGTQQVGWVLEYDFWADEVVKKAVVWNGSSADFFYLPMDGFLESWAWGIDDYGNIVGGAIEWVGTEHAVIWQPIPEPATISLLALGGLAIVGRRRRK